MELVHARARRRMSRGLKRKPMALIKRLRKAKKSELLFFLGGGGGGMRNRPEGCFFCVCVFFLRPARNFPPVQEISRNAPPLVKRLRKTKKNEF